MADDYTKNKPNTLERLGSGSGTASGLDRFADQQRNFDRMMNERRVELQRIENEIAQAQRRQQQAQNMLAGLGNMPRLSATDLHRMGFPQDAAARVGSMGRDKQQLAIMDRSGTTFDFESARLDQLQRERNEAFEARRIAATGTFESSISHALNPDVLAKETRALARAPGMRPGTQAMASRYTDTELRRLIEKNRVQQESVAEQVVAASQNYGEEGGAARFQNEARRLDRHVGTGASLMAAVAAQKKQGRDLEGQYDASSRLASSIGGSLQTESMRQRIATGQVGTMGQEGQKLTNLGTDFLAAFEKFKNEIDSTGDATKALRDELHKTEVAYKDQEKLVKEMGRTGGGGGGNTIDNMRRGIGFFSQQLGAAQYAAVDAQIANVANRTGMANFTNQRYFDSFDATQGNMGALRRISGGTFDRAAGRGDELGVRTSVIKSAQVGMGAMDMGLVAYEGAAQKVGQGGLASFITAPLEALAGASANIGAKGGEVLASTVVNTADMALGISAGQSALSGAVANVNLENAVNAVPDAVKQRMFDFNMSSYGQTVGMGGRASGIFGTMTGSNSRSAMASLGLTPEQGAALYGQGARSIGADFTGRSDGGFGVVFGAARAQNSRITSAEDYMRRVGQMAAVGGGQGNIEEILANAVARGVDNAKSFGDLTDAIADLSSAGVAGGIGTTLGVQQSVLHGMDSLSASGMNEQMKLAFTKSGILGANQSASSLGLSLGGLSERGRTNRDFPGIDPFVALNVQSSNVTELQTLLKMVNDPKSDLNLIQSTSENMGLSSLTLDPMGAVSPLASDNLTKMLTNKTYKVIESRGAAGLSPKAKERLVSFSMGQIGWDDLSASEKDTAKALDLNQATLTAAGPGASASQALAKWFDPNSDVLNSAKQIAKTSAQAQNDQISAGENFTNSKNPLEAIAASMSRAADRLDAVASATDSALSAENMKLDTSGFDNSVVKFDAVVDRLIAAVGSQKNVDAQQPRTPWGETWSVPPPKDPPFVPKQG